MAKEPSQPGRITEALAGARFRVRMDDGKEVIAYMAGKMRVRKISLEIGDKVDVVLDPYEGAASNRIVWRR
jgi:translation initiation factor IF-1